MMNEDQTRPGGGGKMGKSSGWCMACGRMLRIGRKEGVAEFLERRTCSRQCNADALAGARSKPQPVSWRSFVPAPGRGAATAMPTVEPDAAR